MQFTSYCENQQNFVFVSYLVLGIFELSKQIVGDVGTVIGVNETESIQSTAFRVAGAGSNFFWQIALHKGQSLVLVPTVDDAQRSRRCQFGPICCSGQPFKIIPKSIKKRTITSLAHFHCFLLYRNASMIWSLIIICNIKISDEMNGCTTGRHVLASASSSGHFNLLQSQRFIQTAFCVCMCVSICFFKKQTKYFC